MPAIHRLSALFVLACIALPVCAGQGGAALAPSSASAAKEKDAAVAAMAREVMDLAGEALKSESPGLPQDKQARLEQLARTLLREHADSVAAADAGYIYTFQAGYPRNTTYLRRFYEATANPEVRERIAPSLLNLYSATYDDWRTAAAQRTDIAAALRSFAVLVCRDMPDHSTMVQRMGAAVNALEHSVGDRLPAVQIERIGGGHDSLASHRGRIVVVDVWATWCPPCVAGLPGLAKFHEEMSDRPFEVVSLSMDRKPQDVVDHMKTQPMPWTNLYIGFKSPLLEEWGINGYPTYFVLDAEGVVRTRFGEFDADAKDFVRELVRELESGADAGYSAQYSPAQL